MIDYETRYFRWLSNRVNVRAQSPAWHTIQALHECDFQWSVDFDENRAEDGKHLRREFAFDHDSSDIPPEWFDEPCTFFEMLVGISDKMAIQLDRTTATSFWHIMRNLGITKSAAMELGGLYAMVDAVNNRRYYRDGFGGMFPLHNPLLDQREVEIIQQMYDYILEKKL